MVVWATKQSTKEVYNDTDYKLCEEYFNPKTACCYSPCNAIGWIIIMLILASVFTELANGELYLYLIGCFSIVIAFIIYMRSFTHLCDCADYNAEELETYVNIVKKNSESTFGWYEVRCATKVRIGPEFDSKFVDVLQIGTRVEIKNIKGKDAYIEKPIIGWCPLMNEIGEIMLERVLPEVEDNVILNVKEIASRPTNEINTNL